MRQPLAYVHPDAEIADNVVIEPFVTIDKNVKIDNGTWIGSNVTIHEGARIGKNCKIFPGAVISSIPQDLKFKGERTTAEIGNNTTIREYVTVNRGTKTTGKTIIGNNCLIMAYAHIAHDCKIGDNVILVNATQLAGEVVIDEWAILSGLVAVHQFVHIGKHALVSGGSLVGKDVPPYVKAARDPLSYVGVNSIGLRRRNFTNEQIREIQDVYRYLYVRGLNNSEAIKAIETKMPVSQARDEIILFVLNSKRGIMKGYYNLSDNNGIS